MRLYLIVFALFIMGCMANNEAVAGVKARGVRYKKIDFNLLVNTYKNAYQKAGFEVAALDDNNKTPARWRMSFLLPNHSKNKRLSIDISITPVSDKTCFICTVFTEIPETYLVGLDQQMRQADAKAKEQIDQQLYSYSWIAPPEWRRSGMSLIPEYYKDIGVVDLISAYKQAYAEFGFELENIIVRVDKEGLEETRQIVFKLTNTEQHEIKGHSTLLMKSSRSYWCDPCEMFTNFYSDGVSANNFHEFEIKDKLARNLADFKLAKFRYSPTPPFGLL